jgi:hypothetical protein
MIRWEHLSDNCFIHNFTDYERDGDRCYMLDTTSNPRSAFGLVRRRISKAKYEELLAECRSKVETKKDPS